jgi:hypothetical protein
MIQLSRNRIKLIRDNKVINRESLFVKNKIIFKELPMKYAFVTISIIAIWIAVILMVIFLKQKDIMLPLVALIMTVILFAIGFGGKK